MTDRQSRDPRGSAGPEQSEDPPPAGAAFQGVTSRPRRLVPVAVILAGVGLVAFALLTKGPLTTEVVPSVAVEALVPSAPSGLVSNEASVPPGPSPTPGAPSLDPAATPLPTFLALPAVPGTVHLVPDGRLPVRVSMVLPNGWQQATAGIYVKGRGEAPAGMSIGAWSLRDVQVFPCRWAAGVVADPALMATAAGQSEALADWWGQDPRMPPYSNSPLAPSAIRPRATTFAGYPAQYLETLILLGFDFSQCDAGQLVLWDGTNGEPRLGLGPGELHRLWVVDVDGTVVVIDAATYAGTSPADQAELQAMLDSITIEP